MGIAAHPPPAHGRRISAVLISEPSGSSWLFENAADAKEMMAFLRAMADIIERNTVQAASDAGAKH
jgi:hypothetical protein